MIRVAFRNIDQSEFAREAVLERLEAVVERFPDLHLSSIGVTLTMENSPHQAGPDLFRVQVTVRGGRYDKIVLEKSAPNLYVALARVVEAMLERLNRRGDRSRVKARRQARKFAHESWTMQGS